MNHFAKVCRKQKNSKPQNPKKRTLKTAVEEPHTEDLMNFLQSSKLYESHYSRVEDNMVAVIQNDIAKMEPLNQPINIGKISATLLVDSGSACSIFNWSLASQAVRSSPHAFWIHYSEGFTNPQLRTFSNEPIRIEGKVTAPVSSNGWTSNSATFTVVADGLKSLIGRDLFDQLRLAVTQSSLFSGNQVNAISPSSEFKEHIALTLPNLISCIGRSKNHVVKSKFRKNFQPRNRKSRRISNNLQDKVNNELKKLLAEKHIIKLTNCPDKFLNFPIVVTVKKDQTTKPALDSKTLNKAIHKIKYQMPNIDTFIESISLQISAPAPQTTTYFSTLDLKYAYSQLNLDPDTTNNCNFTIISGDMTGTFRFQIGFFGLMDMPAELQKCYGFYPHWSLEYLLFSRRYFNCK